MKQGITIWTPFPHLWHVQGHKWLTQNHNPPFLILKAYFILFYIYRVLVYLSPQALRGSLSFIRIQQNVWYVMSFNIFSFLIKMKKDMMDILAFKETCFLLYEMWWPIGTKLSFRNRLAFPFFWNNGIIHWYRSRGRATYLSWEHHCFRPLGSKGEEEKNTHHSPNSSKFN